MKLIYPPIIWAGGLACLLVSGCASSRSQAGHNLPPAVQVAAVQSSSLEGKWEYTMSNPDQDPFSGVMVVQRGGDAGYTGWISVSTINYEAPTKVTKAEIQGDHFTYVGEVQTRVGSYPFELTGTIKGNKMTGENKVKTEDGPVVFKVIATRQ